jgi:hypothetical protein
MRKKLLPALFGIFGIHYEYRNRKEYFNPGDSCSYEIQYYHWDYHRGHHLHIEIGVRRWEWEW